ncbi:uncharacterized protein LOC127853992 [Dreissena polymorpha]|uniref:uncharacterized protein LOC127853992 n=1 Tax=Dreissena polymorpha TaxID=45954 RepID=UPI0022647653|nr:uncharacterized protein LOC127853992 [Dreissena polymorpha]
MDVHDNYLSSLVSKKLVINVTDVNEQNYLRATKTTTITFKESKKIGTKFDFGLQCTDEDFYDEQTLTIVGGSYMDFFRLNNTDKVIYLAQEWNLEDNMTSNTIIEVQCEDTGGHRSNVNLNFIIEDVNDNKPEMTVTFSPGWSSNLQINSKTSLSTVFLVVFAYDADIGDSNFVFKVLGNGLGRKYFRLVARESRKRSTGATIAELKLRQAMKLNYHKQFVFHIMVSDGGSPPKFSAFPLSVNYTADDPIPQAAESSNCITCSSKGQLLIGMLATECVIVVVLITHALYAFGLIFKSGYPVVALKIKPLANPRMKVMNIPTNKKFSIQPAPPFKRQSYSNSSSSSSESDDEQVYTRVNETKLYRLSRDPRVESSQFRPSGHYPVVAFPKPVYSSQVEPHFGVVHKHSEMKEFSRTMFNGGPPLTHGSVGTGLPPAFYAGQEKAHLPGTSFK